MFETIFCKLRILAAEPYNKSLKLDPGTQQFMDRRKNTTFGSREIISIEYLILCSKSTIRKPQKSLQRAHGVPQKTLCESHLDIHLASSKIIFGFGLETSLSQK